MFMLACHVSVDLQHHSRMPVHGSIGKLTPQPADRLRARAVFVDVDKTCNLVDPGGDICGFAPKWIKAVKDSSDYRNLLIETKKAVDEKHNGMIPCVVMKGDGTKSAVAAA